MRNSYSSRAGLILSADAIILAAIVFLLDKNFNQQNEVSTLVGVLAFLSLGFMSISLFFALRATTTLKGNSRQATRFEGPHRLFLNPGETLDELKDYEVFQDHFRGITFESIIESYSAELWVALSLQRDRYKILKKSIVFILCAFGALVIALTIALLH